MQPPKKKARLNVVTRAELGKKAERMHCVQPPDSVLMLIVSFMTIFEFCSGPIRVDKAWKKACMHPAFYAHIIFPLLPWRRVSDYHKASRLFATAFSTMLSRGGRLVKSVSFPYPSHRQAEDAATIIYSRVYRFHPLLSHITIPVPSGPLPESAKIAETEGCWLDERNPVLKAMEQICGRQRKSRWTLSLPNLHNDPTAYLLLKHMHGELPSMYLTGFIRDTCTTPLQRREYRTFRAFDVHGNLCPVGYDDIWHLCSKGCGRLYDRTHPAQCNVCGDLQCAVDCPAAPGHAICISYSDYQSHRIRYFKELCKTCATKQCHSCGVDIGPFRVGGSRVHIRLRERFEESQPETIPQECFRGCLFHYDPDNVLWSKCCPPSIATTPMKEILRDWHEALVVPDDGAPEVLSMPSPGRDDPMESPSYGYDGGVDDDDDDAAWLEMFTLPPDDAAALQQLAETGDLPLDF